MYQYSWSFAEIFPRGGGSVDILLIIFRMDFRKKLYPFYTTKKIADVTEKITKCASLAAIARYIAIIYTAGHLQIFNAVSFFKQALS